MTSGINMEQCMVFPPTGSTLASVCTQLCSDAMQPTNESICIPLTTHVVLYIAGGVAVVLLIAIACVVMVIIGIVIKRLATIRLCTLNVDPTDFS